MRPCDRPQLPAQPRLLVRAGSPRQAVGGPVRTDHEARSTFENPEPLPHVHDSTAATVRGQEFPSASSLSMSMSSAWLATSFFKRAFSASSCLSRFASVAFIPSYWDRLLFHVASEISRVRSTSVRSLSSLSIRSPSRSLRTTCSAGVSVSLRRDRPPRPQCGLLDSHNGWTTAKGSCQRGRGASTAGVAARIVDP